MVTITDDDVPAVEVSFELATYTVAEGDDASTVDKRENEVTVKVTLSANPERTVDIPLTLTNQEASSDDYSGVPASVTFNAGDIEKSFTFTATDDAEDDDGESVKLTFGNTLPDGVSVGSPAETIVSITDDDAPSSLTVNFEASTYNVTEGSTVEVVLTLDDDPEREVIIPFSKTNQGGASDSDYSGVPTSVIFNAGEVSKSFEFSAASDRISDPGEKVSINLGTPPSGVTKGTTSETVVTIEDVAPLGSTTVSFGADTYGVSEGSSTTITVVMSPAPGSDVIIPIETEELGGATSTDYSGVPASAIFGPTDIETSFTFTAADDTEDDDDESVKFTFGTLPTGISKDAPSETTVSITDNDVPAVEVSFDLATYTVAEGETKTVKVILNEGPEREVIIPIGTEGQDGATADDYTVAPASVTFGPTVTEQTFTFTANQDTDNDDGESVKLTFVNLPGGVSVGNPAEAVVTITDDDVPAVEVSFEHSSYSVAESDDARSTCG